MTRMKQQQHNNCTYIVLFDAQAALLKQTTDGDTENVIKANTRDHDRKESCDWTRWRRGSFILTL